MNDSVENVIKKIFNIETNGYIFVYTPPKVGSTTLVTSLRISLGKRCNVIHIHDETMLSVLTGIKNVKINDIINYLSNKGKIVYVIDIYRTPIERKMSEFFEKICPYHFNNTEENISKYSLSRITKRFNSLFPYLEKGDHYFEKYNINNPVTFDFMKKYTIQEINKIKYVKIRLCDSNIWGLILSSIFNKDIVIIDDYKTENKKIGELYKKFKKEYKIPSNFIEIIKKCKYFNFYYNEEERNKYITQWTRRCCENFTPYTENEYNFYMNICLENQYINDIQINHYIDNGCFCNLCSKKRQKIFLQVKNGKTNCERIIHNEVVYEHQIKVHFDVMEEIRKQYSLRPANKKFSNGQFKMKIM